jgi:hypothetical protein
MWPAPTFVGAVGGRRRAADGPNVLADVAYLIVTVAAPTKPGPAAGMSSPSMAKIRFTIVILGGG